MDARLLIWGIGEFYAKICNVLKLNEAIGNFRIEAFVSKDYERKIYDGKIVIRPEEIMEKYGGGGGVYCYSDGTALPRNS